MALQIMDAIENLNTIIDAETLNELEVTDDMHFVSHRGDEEEYWVKPSPDLQTVDALRKTFQVVYDYLHDFYKHTQSNPKKLVKGFNSIMVLVGEAARKFDHLGVLFAEKVSDFKEFQKLQDLYQNKVIKKVFSSKGGVEEEAGTWDEEVANLIEENITETAGVHLLDDYDTVKTDHSYELFYLLNEEGNHFYSQELTNILKLATDFTAFEADDPLVQVKNWEDKSLQLLANRILKSSKNAIEKFYKVSLKHRELEVIQLVHKALMALMLAANPRNLIRQFSKKGCHRYFNDFQVFLRHALHHPEYLRFASIVTTKKEQPFIEPVLNLIHALCVDLYTIGPDREEIGIVLKNLIQLPHDKNQSLSELLGISYRSLAEKLEKHPSGPILKAMDIVRENEEGVFSVGFDPIMQGNLPERLCELDMGQRMITFLRVPSPTVQESIQKAFLNPEFSEFATYHKDGLHLTFVNFQDRTSWKEHARTQAIEEMGRHAQFAKSLTIVTLAKNTEFYHQLGAYYELSNAKAFITQFLNHLEDEATGYYFPKDIKKELFPDWMSQLLQTIHSTFFKEKKELSLEDRLNFIEITYSLIVIKLFELIDADYLALSSKDALDIGSVSMVALIAFLFCDREKSWDIDKINTILFGPTLILRERIIHLERFDRLFQMICVLEENKKYRQEFNKLFQPSTLNATIKF